MEMGIWTLILAVMTCWLSEASNIHGWSTGAHATFYGGSHTSATMGGACGYDNVYREGYGINTAALSSALFRDGEACGTCFRLMCDAKSDRKGCLPNKAVTVTATNFCPPNSNINANNGGWCNLPLRHFDLSLPAFAHIAVYRQGIVPVLYRRVACVKRGGVHFTMKGHSYFNLVLISNVGGSGDVRSVWVKGSHSTGWQAMHRNWGAHWQNNAKLDRQGLSFRLTAGDGRTLTFNNVIHSNWQFGQTFVSKEQF